MVIHESGKNISEGVTSATPEKFGAYDWGRSQKRPAYWAVKRTFTWDCPECDWCNTKLTKQKDSNRYYPVRGECKNCGKRYRNVIAFWKQWFDHRKDAKDSVDIINSAKGLR